MNNDIPKSGTIRITIQKIGNGNGVMQKRVFNIFGADDIIELSLQLGDIIIQRIQGFSLTEYAFELGQSKDPSCSCMPCRSAIIKITLQETNANPFHIADEILRSFDLQ